MPALRHLAFIAPRFLENTNRFVAAFAQLPGLALSLISEDGPSSIPPEVRPHVMGFERVSNPLDGTQLTQAVKNLSRAHGPVDRLVGALEQLQLPMAEARDATGTPGMGVMHAKRFRDKDEMKRVLRAAGVPVAASTLATAAADVRAFVDRIGYPLIVKPPAGLGSKGTHRLETADDLAAMLAADAPSREQPWQVEQFLRAREFTCETVTVRGRHVWHSGTRYFPTPLEVLETPWIQYCVLMPKEADEAPWAAFHSVNEAALDALFEGASPEAATALTHMEWFLKDDGSMAVGEVGARPPGVHIMPMMSLAHGTSLISDWAALMAFEMFDPKPRKWATGAAFFRAQGGGRHVTRVNGLQQAIDSTRDVLVEMRTPKVGQPRAPGYEGEGWAIIKAPTTERATEALRSLVQQVQVRCD